MDTQNPLSQVNVVSIQRRSDPLMGTWHEVMLSNGKQYTLQRMDAGSSMGLPGWHCDGRYLADTKADALSELLRQGRAIA